MKKLIIIIAGIIAGLSVYAQKDIVSMQEAALLFKHKSVEKSKEGLAKMGYTYKGISSDNYGKDHNWVKNMDLTNSFLPTKFGKGNSSMVMQAVDGSTLYVYVFNRAAFTQLQAQVKAMGYEIGKPDKAGTIVCVKDDEPTFTFLLLSQPLPYCVQITE